MSTSFTNRWGQKKGAIVIVWQLDLQLPVQSVPITTKLWVQSSSCALITALSDNVYQWLATVLWFSPGTQSFLNDKTEILFKSGVKNGSFNYYFGFRIFECCLYLKTTLTTTSQLVHISLYIYWYSSVYDNRSNSFQVVSMPCIFPSVISLEFIQFVVVMIVW